MVKGETADITHELWEKLDVILDNTSKMCHNIAMYDYSLFSKYIHKLLSIHFHSLSKPHLKTLSDLVVAMFNLDKFTLRDIASRLPSKTHVKHKLKRLQNFLDRLNVDEEFWRSYVRMVFTLPYFQPRRRKRIILLMDSTTLKDDYWILAVSVIYRNRAIPIYLGIWERVNESYDYWGRVREVVRMAKEILPGRYEYEIVADRGFGSRRMWEICEEVGWDYVTRINDTYKVKVDGNGYKQLSLLDGYGYYEAVVLGKSKPYSGRRRGINLVVSEKGGKRWYIATSLRDRGMVIEDYKRRMWIEESFKDLKGRLKWERYTAKLPLLHRMRKLIIVSVMSYAIQLSLGGKVKVPRSEEEKESLISRFNHIYVSTWRTVHLIFTRMISTVRIIVYRMCGYAFT